MKKLASIIASIVIIAGTFIVSSVSAKGDANNAKSDVIADSPDNLILKHADDLFASSDAEMISHASHSSHSSHGSHGSHSSHSSHSSGY